MATDIILKDQEIQVTGGNLNIDQGLKLGTTFSSNANKLEFNPSGLVVKNDKNSTRIQSEWISSDKSYFKELSSNEIYCNKLQLGRGSVNEPANPGFIDIQDGISNKTISLDGKTGIIKCKDIEIETIGNLVQIIKKLQNDIRILQSK